MRKIRIGTRGSKLALKQASMVQEALLQTEDGIETELVILRTKGDRIQDKPLSEIGEKGVFASELEQALLAGEIDLAVHSAKDLPMELAEGLKIAAVLPRADVRDVLVVPRGGRLPHLRLTEPGRESGVVTVPAGNPLRNDGGIETEFVAACEEKESRCIFRIGSGSRRRRLLAGQFWSNVVCENIRGNVETRLRKLQEGSYDGIILAKAGLDRLGIGNEGEQEQSGDAFLLCPLSPEQFLPAACQGIIAVEAVRDSGADRLCRKITDAETELCYAVEREVLARLAADCSEAAAAWCRRDGEALVLDAMYAGDRVRLTCPARLQEGRKMAGQAAGLLKGSAET